MFKSKVPKTAERAVDKRIWRMSPTNPAGEFVSAASRQTGTETDPPEGHARDLRASSLELASGSDVQETDLDTLPGELREAFTESTARGERGVG